jgi:hypothetical protein
MQEIMISTIDDVYSIQNKKNAAAVVRIDVRSLKRTGAIRYAFKYALWALKVGGELVVQDAPRSGFGFSTRSMDFWQIRNELFKVLKDDVSLIALDDADGTICVRKTKDSYRNSGFTFGLVFSGNEAELAQLQPALESIAHIRGLSDFPHEVVICGPSTFDSAALVAKFHSLPIRYLAVDDVFQGNRVMITKKKNALIDTAAFNVVCLSHARILYAESFVACIQAKQFDALTPKVIYNANGQRRKYLDFTLSGSYDTSRANTYSVLSHEVLPDNVLHYMARRVPYIDGGLTILNKDKIGNIRYCPDLAWGEAEDIDLCARLYYDGFLIDYASECECESQTTKIDYSNSVLRKLKRRLQQALVRRQMV